MAEPYFTALTRSEIWLRHVKSALRRVNIRDYKAVGTGNRPLVYFIWELVKHTKRLPGRGAGKPKV